ncbi:BCCT family transporter [Vibrio sp. V27_P1S3P104]|uniref:BCCT family transporter n=1 Tax=unclassified Vibrio TaxID=2614977 RepID=UPI00137370C5|nr:MULTISPECIES: BCCT family transporter [unclassified Vibrio]NAW68929.1 BCCT family transporter [Vibrio sp. V28_P6S34P95]NAX05130.1 BCCT family transporter [Vibrio sp. V30_P3S12P165]NAX34157.1 BCCT family transporter [Vibrio sp. V29_P1S30P107]NAX37610.1 BCCT family transporter [Vibrio sp. V27_P1S3P104]NNN44281.1 BCCT family transporter [Vibrio sp. 1-1(7)]
MSKVYLNTEAPCMSASDYSATHPPQTSSHSLQKKLELNNPVLWLSGSFLSLFVLLALTNPSLLTSLIDSGFHYATQGFGAFWQLLLLANFVIGLALAVTQTGSVRLGGLSIPELDNFKWLSIILCTLLAGGGVFWAAAEPIAHFVSAPPIFGAASPQKMAINALSQSFMHWGFLAWAILGCLSSIVLMHLHYDKGLPLKPRTLLYPILGQRAVNGWIANTIDALSIIAVAAGTIGPIGFLGLQISYALNALFGIPDSFTTQIIVILFAMALYTFSALSGLSKGIQIISRYNIILAVGLVLFILIAGPTHFIIDGYMQGVASMIDNFVPMAMFRADTDWLSWWTVFFWGWFIGYGPMMAIFIARISRGRTLRQLILAISIAAPLITCFWFSIVGGSGLAFELANPGVIAQGFEGFNLPGALLAITAQLPFPLLVSLLFLVLTTTFIVTTGDSMTYTISVVISGDTNPNAAIRAFWGIVMGAMAIVLISMGEGGISALQSFIVITAVPASLILLPCLWQAPKMANQMAKDQGIIH